MSETNIPTLRRTSMMMVFSQAAVVALVIGIINVVTQPVSPISSIAAGIMFYIVYSFGSRMILTAAHRRGVKRVREKKWQAAVKAFEESYAFFTRFAWLDEYRFITMLTPTSISYREMALNNMGFALVQMGNNKQAKQHYAKLLEQFPQSDLAGTAHRVLAAIEKQGK